MLIRFALLSIFLAACGGTIIDNSDGGNSDGGTNGDTAPPPSSDATLDSPSACNALEPVGSPVTITQIASDAPPFGASSSMVFAIGLYELQSITIYTGVNGTSGTSSSVDAAARISAAKDGFIFQAVSVTDNAPPFYSTSTAIPTTANQLTFTQVCPSMSPPESASYSFDGKTLTFRVVLEGSNSGTVDEQLLLIGK